MRLDGVSRLIMIEDNPMIAAGVQQCLRSSRSIKLVGVLAPPLNGEGGWKKLHPDLVLLGVSGELARTIDLAEEVRAKTRTAKLILWLTCSNTTDLRHAMRAEADGYIDRNSSPVELLHALELVSAGGSYISATLAKSLASVSAPTMPITPQFPFTPREKEVLGHIKHGLNNRQMAECMFLGVRTIEKFRGEIMKKLDVHSAEELVRFAVTQWNVSG